MPSSSLDLFVARQPIFNGVGQVEGYELLYRSGAQSVAADGASTRQMSVDVIIQSLLEIGLERITLGRTAFLNFSREMLVSDFYDLLDRSTVVVELLEDVKADDEVVRVCERLVKAGYRIALDDYEPNDGRDALLGLAEIIKIDVLNRNFDDLRGVVEPLSGRKLRLLAERVETAEVRDECRQMGFELFQGYFFAKPELITKSGTSVDHLLIIQLMNLVRDDRVEDAELDGGFRRDPSLSHKLLRMVNAASFGVHGVDSILQAIRLLGRITLHRWLAILLVSSFAKRDGVGSELVQAAILRARFCELLGESTRKAPGGTLFMVGLFSRMDALFGAPMDEVLSEIDLAPEVKMALLRREGPYADWLRLAEAYEAGDWEQVSTVTTELGISPLNIPDLYLQSVDWTRERLQSES
ncbi:MAG: HDOD domain-containing protein [Gemmatimonadetes bacterium]|nr:HDOD domain-containing protein [Gemmatimonadota bacterium]